MNSFEEVVDKLKTVYDTSEPLYLSSFFQPNGEKWLYESLSALHQEEYKNNYRIIVVQDCNDVYDYADLPGQAITALQKFSSQIDISNFFILLISNNQQIKEELAQAQELYSTDANPIQHYIVDLVPYEKTITTGDTFCILPWMHIYVGTDGNLLPCCNGMHQHPMGNVRTDSIDNILKSSKYNQLRKNLLTGQRSKECKRCYDFEDAGHQSPRLKNNKKWAHLKTLEFNNDGTVDKFTPAFLDIRLSNICNLKCRMCDGYFSSAIAQEDAELFGNYTHLNNSLPNKDRQAELVDILKYVPFAEEIYFAGGEPLLNSEHYEMLNKLIECGNTNLRLFYNTNFTKLSFKNISVTDLWNKFSNVTVGASLDAMGDVAEYVRFGTDWKEIEQNLARVKAEAPHVNFTVMSTVSFMTVASLIELQKQWHNNNILNINKFTLNTTISPDYLTVRVLPSEHKQQMSLLISEHIQWCRENHASKLAGQWQETLDYMLSADHSHCLGQFKHLTNIVDIHRNQSFVKVFPEFQDLLS